MRAYNPPQFAVPRFRTLLLLGIGAGVATLFYGGILYFAALSNQPFMLKAAMFQTLFYIFFILLIIPLLSRSWRPSLLFGLPQGQEEFRKHLFLVFPLIAIAIASTFLCYLPLSYIFPGFVESYLLDQPQLMSTTSMVSNLSGFFLVVVAAPIFEECLFRGLLLTRWAIKWNVPRAIWWSSFLFGVAHADFLGAFFFGYVMCVVYIKTKSLFIPICLHATNNGIVWLLGGVDLLITGSGAKPTISEFQSYWRVGLGALVIVTPWVIRFLRHNFPQTNWPVPYLALQASEEEPTSSTQEYLSLAA
jgi:uncharacterized protein